MLRSFNFNLMTKENSWVPKSQTCSNYFNLNVEKMHSQILCSSKLKQSLKIKLQVRLDVLITVFVWKTLENNLKSARKHGWATAARLVTLPTFPHCHHLGELSSTFSASSNNAAGIKAQGQFSCPYDLRSSSLALKKTGIALPFWESKVQGSLYQLLIA